MSCIVRACVLLSVSFSVVVGHGRLMDPPSRNSMWRSGFPNPRNYNDNELNCGGFSYQWRSKNGKCGVCGDPYGRVQEHVFPGKYANNIITKTYKKGSGIDVGVHITANHKGYFTFRLGDIGEGAITEEKLSHVLKVARTESTRYYLPKGSGAGHFKLSLQLPQTLVCRHCVLQWTYVAGNSWGTDESGSGVGNGAQETFVNCADISIADNDGPQTTVKVSSGSTSAPGTLPRSESITPATDAPPKSTTTTTLKEKMTMTRTTAKITEAPTNPRNSKCHGVGLYAGVPGMDAWCDANCPQFCPTTHCTCTNQPTPTNHCRGTGAYAKVAGIDSWCNSNCPSFCPKSHCVCAAQ